jgi:DNA-directed RNA polymerase specialized sigma24 family protein
VIARTDLTSLRRLVTGSTGHEGGRLVENAEGVSVGKRFETTRWSLVLAAAGDSREALEWLCSTYWYPLYAFIRRHGHDAEAARDLTQSFFLRVLDGDLLRRADPQRGRFRTFLLASVKHFMANERTRAEALKRRADDPAFQVPLDGAESRYLADRTSASARRRCSRAAGRSPSSTARCAGSARSTRARARGRCSGA